jgi:hypothetical protein
MTDTPDEQRSRPTPRPRPAASARPSPRPRVAGSRRDREDAETGVRAARPAPAPRTASADTSAVDERPAVDKPAASARPVAGKASTAKTATAQATTAQSTVTSTAKATAAAKRGTRAGARTTEPTSGRRRLPALALVLALLCVLAAAGVGLLLWQRLNPTHVDSSIFAATRDGVQALYAYDYRDSEQSVEDKLAVLTGDLRQQYEADLDQGGIIDAYEQVSATTRYEVLDVGLQQVNDAQDTATLVVFGQYVVESVNSGEQEAPEGSECQVTPEGAQSCTQTVQVRVLQVDGEWKISELTLLTTS